VQSLIVSYRMKNETGLVVHYITRTCLLTKLIQYIIDVFFCLATLLVERKVAQAHVGDIVRVLTRLQ